MIISEKFDEVKKNEDIEIWRKVKDDHYSPSIHVTKHSKIGIDVGGSVYVMSIEEWHKLRKEKEQLKKIARYAMPYAEAEAGENDGFKEYADDLKALEGK